MGLSINDSVYSCLFFFLTGLHFFHLLVGLSVFEGEEEEAEEYEYYQEESEESAESSDDSAPQFSQIKHWLR